MSEWWSPDPFVSGSRDDLDSATRNVSAVQTLWGVRNRHGKRKR